jgi:hypothetical protein
MGVRHALFPGPALDALPFRGLPDSRRHSPRQAEFRPRGRTVQRLSAAEFQVRLFSSLQLVVAATGLRTRSRHACDFLSRLDRMAPGQPPLLAARSPEATGLASSLIVCFYSQVQRCCFITSPVVGSFTRGLPGRRDLPVTHSLFVRLSAFFFGEPNHHAWVSPESRVTC